MRKKLYTCAYVIRNNPETRKAEVLLGEKKRGDGAGTYEGYGGKVERSDASIEHAALREFMEESNTVPSALHKFGIIGLYLPGNDFVMQCHLFYGYGLDGEPQETDEMKPFWFPVDAIPFDMVGDDYRYWWHLFRNDKMFIGTFTFNEQNKVTGKYLNVVDELPAEL